VQGLSHQEIADATGIPLETIKTHMLGNLTGSGVLGLGKRSDQKGGGYE
jgi:hypothetical protein